MALPFQPEPEAILKLRFVSAMTPVYNSEEILRGGVRPGEQRKHVFDFDDGMRMIASRERLGEEVFMHVSVSFMPGKQKVGQEMMHSVLTRVNEMRGLTCPGLIRAFVTDGNVVHFIFPEHISHDGVVLPPVAEFNR